MKFSEVVQQVIQLGDASLRYWDVELPKHHPEYPIIRDGEEQTPPPPEAAQIESLLRGLPEEQLYSLMLLAYLGRGDFNADHLPAADRRNREAFPNRAMVIAQLMDEQTIADYLTDAVDEVRKRHIDLDQLPVVDTASAI